MGNQTTVTAGGLGTCIATVFWWYMRQFQGIEAPETVIAASTGIIIAAFQFAMPNKPAQPGSN